MGLTIKLNYANLILVEASQNTFSKCLERVVALQRPERYRGLL